MTKTTTFYFDTEEIENLYIVSLEERYYDCGKTFVVRYETRDTNSKVKDLRTKTNSLEDAITSIELYIDFIQRYNRISHITKQTITHEDVTNIQSIFEII